MPKQDEDNEVDLIKDFLKENNYTSTLECFIKEDNYKRVENKNSKDKKEEKKDNKFTKYVQSSRECVRKISKFQNTYNLLEKKYKSILLCARQVFSISINCIEMLQELKDGNKKENLEETIENFKSQIGKYHKIIMSDSWDENTKTINQAVMIEHKNNLKKAKDEKNNDKIVEILLSLRVYALQIQPELRRNLVEDLIENDILFIQENNSDKFVLDLLNTHSYSMKHAILSLISIISSTFKGVEYLNSNGSSIIEKVMDIIKSTEDGQVIQRFAIAILQKMSIKENIIKIYLKNGLIDWINKLLERSRTNEVHIFCLDFGSALIANMLQCNFVLDFLEKNMVPCKSLMENFLGMIKEKIPTSVLMHILICLKYLGKNRFKKVKDECKFIERIKDFNEYYNNIKPSTEFEKLDKNTILDLSESLFNIKEDTKEINYESKFQEYDNLQKIIVFECFQDEIS